VWLIRTNEAALQRVHAFLSRLFGHDNTRQKRSQIGKRLLFVLLLLSACRPQSPEPARLQLQSAHAAKIQKLILVYTQSAEMGLASLRDILRALPETEALVINQFAPNSAAFRTFVTQLLRDGIGRNRQGKPRVQFVQEESAYGPWPRDQALVDEQGLMWVSSSNLHQLQATMLALDESYGIPRRAAAFSFTGASLLRSDKGLLCPDRLDTVYLANYLQGPFLPMASPAPPEPFHLDLLVMPLNERVIAVGDDQLAKTALLSLSAEEVAKVAEQWVAEYCAAASNVEFQVVEGRLKLRELNRPALIIRSLLEEKLRIVAALSQGGAFREAVQAEPDYVWDDQIAAHLTRLGFAVVRVPFWPAAHGAANGKKVYGLPMLCYPNCLVWEEGILMPVYGIPVLDEMAKTRLEGASRKTVYPVSGGALLGYGYSGPHCLTLEFRK